MMALLSFFLRQRFVPFLPSKHTSILPQCLLRRQQVVYRRSRLERLFANTCTRISLAGEVSQVGHCVLRLLALESKKSTRGPHTLRFTLCVKESPDK